MFLKKWPAGSHFGCPKITFYCISYHFRSIPQFLFLWNFFTKWLPSAILDVRNSLWITFLAILYQYRFCNLFKFFYKMAAGGHFGCPKFTLDHISGHFRSIQILFFFWFVFTKWQPVAILDVRKSLSISFLSISHRYATLNFLELFGWRRPFLDVRNSLSIAFLAISYRYATSILFLFLTKWLPAAILDVRNSLSIAILAISDPYGTSFFFF